MQLSQTTAPVIEPLHLDEAKSHLRVSGTDEDDLIGTLIAAARGMVEDFTGRQLALATWTLKLDAWPGTSYVRLPRAPLVAVDSVGYVDTAGADQTFASTDYDVQTDRLPPRIVLGYAKSWPTLRAQAEAVSIAYKTGSVAKITAVADTDLLTIAGRSVADADIIRLSVSGGEDRALPAPLAENTDYHVRDLDGSTFKLAASAGGDALDLTDTGTGQACVGVLPAPLRAALLLLLGDLYEHREAQLETKVSDNPTVARLLWPWRIVEL